MTFAAMVHHAYVLPLPIARNSGMTQASKTRLAPPMRDLTETEKENRKISASTKATARQPKKKSGPRKQSPAGPVKTARKKKNP
jgi:hypothetical protein